MPIRFRCPYCNRLLGIATRKAGMETTCPHCGYTITVPVPQDEERNEERNEERTERVNLQDVEELLGNAATEALPQSVAAAVPPNPPAAERPRQEPPKAPPAAMHPNPRIPAPAPSPQARAPALPVPKPSPRPSSSDDPPLFEGDMDAILGTTKPSAEPEREKPPPVSGLDANSLGDPARPIVIGPQKATLLLILVVVLMALSFVAGMLVKR